MRERFEHKNETIDRASQPTHRAERHQPRRGAEVVVRIATDEETSHDSATELKPERAVTTIRL